MKIQPIVEGYGEVEAIRVLLRRLRDTSGAFPMEFLYPVRKPRAEFIQEGSLRGIIRQTLALRSPDGILVVFDADDDCPRELAGRVQAWASEEAGEIPCAVVMANREFEAWFLASLSSLRGRRGIRHDAWSYPNPESVRGAKERLTGAMRPGKKYSATQDQASLTEGLDLAAAYRACRSFRRLVNAFGIVASQAGVTLQEWPPSSWLTGP
jgi:Domain of unknown function (DUF4276)